MMNSTVKPNFSGGACMARTLSFFLALVSMTVFSAGAATVTGTVSDTGGNPVAGAVVTITVGTTTLVDTTDAQGDYTIANVTAANYPVTANMSAAKSGYNTATATVRITAGNSVVDR